MEILNDVKYSQMHRFLKNRKSKMCKVECKFSISLLLAYSPIISHVNASLQGLSTIRAFNAGKMLEKEFHTFQDHSTSCTYLFSCANAWFSLFMDVVCLLFLASVTYGFLMLESSKSFRMILKCALILGHFFR